MKRIKFRYIFAAYAVVLSCVCMFLIYPAHDDFDYASPKPGINILRGIMPTKTHWRPFDRLIEYGLGYAPFLFPWVNHILVLSSHLILCASLYVILRKITRRRLYSAIGTLFFCLSPGIIYTVTNTDTVNQSWAALMGAASAFSYFKARDENRERLYSCWLGFAFISALFKENGIAWFLAPVLLYMVYEYAKNGMALSVSLKKNSAFILTGILGTLAYFCIRFMLMGKIALGDSSGRYAVSFSPKLFINIIKHYCQIIGGSISSIDTLAFFLKPRNYAVLAFTGIVSIVFLCFVIAMVYGIFRDERKTFNIIAGLFTCALYISSPYTVMAHVSEATAYEMAFMFALIFGIVLSSSRMSRAFVISCALMFLCMISVCCHKIYILHEWSSEIRSFLCEHKADFRNTPSKIFIYFIEDIPEEGYSVYWYTPGHSFASGQAFLSLWEWKPKFRVKHVSSDADVNYPKSHTQFT